MTPSVARPYDGSRDLAALIDFATRLTTARLPGLTAWNPGDIAWQLGMHRPEADLSGFVRQWEDAAGKVVALAVFEPPLNFEFDIDPELGFASGIEREVLDWVEARRRETLSAEGEVPKAYAMLGNETLSTQARDTDLARIAFLEREGYEKVERHGVRYRRTLAGALPEPKLAPGMRFRHATDEDIEGRAELHRDAWSVWGPSSFSAGRYRRLRATPVYDETLDLVVEAEDGRLVSYCICWYDAVNRIGHFEPVGTRPAFAGQGLGRAVVIEGLHRLRAKGAETALIGTASVNAPALKTYTAAGFELVERQHYYSKRLG